MYGLRQILIQEQKYLEKLIMKAQKGLSVVPEGHLRISKDKNRVRYYHCVNDRFGTYIPKGDDQLPKQLAQKAYYMAIEKKAEKRLNQIKKITKDYSDNEIEDIFTHLHKERQSLVTPIKPTWD